MIAAASFRNAPWISSRLSKRMRSLPKPANQPCNQPCALYNPAMLAWLFAALDTSPGNPAGNASSPEIGTAALVVVAFVRMQLRRPLACPPRQARNGWNRIHALLKTSWSRAVGTTDEDRQRDASDIYDEVALAAKLASVRGLGPVSWPPEGLAPRSHLCWRGSHQSGHARADAPAWLGANAARRCQTPSAFQSRKRRQQVIYEF